jgi:hypothetical protein
MDAASVGIETQPAPQGQTRNGSVDPQLIAVVGVQNLILDGMPSNRTGRFRLCVFITVVVVVATLDFVAAARSTHRRSIRGTATAARPGAATRLPRALGGLPAILRRGRFDRIRGGFQRDVLRNAAFFAAPRPALGRSVGAVAAGAGADGVVDGGLGFEILIDFRFAEGFAQ